MKTTLMQSTILAASSLLAQQQGGAAYGVGQIAGVIFLLVLGGAILWKFLKK